MDIKCYFYWGFTRVRNRFTYTGRVLANPSELYRRELWQTRLVENGFWHTAMSGSPLELSSFARRSRWRR